MGHKKYFKLPETDVGRLHFCTKSALAAKSTGAQVYTNGLSGAETKAILQSLKISVFPCL